MKQAPAEIDTAQADIGIVCALPMELADFLKRCERVRHYTGGDFTFRGGVYDGIRVVIVEAGTGRSRAVRATQALVDAHHPRWILSCGFAGALQPNLKIADIVVANRLVAPNENEVRVDFAMPSDAAHGLHVGSLVTVDAIVRTAAEKQTLGREFDALAVDMESHAVADFCRTNQQRFFCVRAISDDAEHDLPPEVLSLMGATGAVRFGAVVGALWKRPSSAQDMLQLRDTANKAAKNLADFLDGTIKQLHRAT